MQMKQWSKKNKKNNKKKMLQEKKKQTKCVWTLYNSSAAIGENTGREKEKHRACNNLLTYIHYARASIACCISNHHMNTFFSSSVPIWIAQSAADNRIFYRISIFQMRETNKSK